MAEATSEATKGICVHPQDQEAAAACGWCRLQGGGVRLLGWIFNFCFCAFSHFHSLRYAAAARGENNQLQQTEADTVQGACTGRGGRGRGRGAGRLACNKCSPTSVGNVCLAHATLCCMQMRHVAPLLMPCNIVATSQREASKQSSHRVASVARGAGN